MPKSHASSFRRIAAAVWSRPREPTIHGILEVDMKASLAYLESVRASGRGRPTVTHLVVRALATALARFPEANAHVRGGRVKSLPSIDLFLQVALEDGADLSGLLVRDADRKSLAQIEVEVRERAGRVRQGRDPMLQKSRGLARRLPIWVLRRALRFAEFVSNGLGWDLPRLGIPRRPFGSALVTSVGMLGIDVGLPPFFPLSDAPILLCVGRVHDRPVAVEGRVEVRPVCVIGATIDHRVLDGALVGKMATVMRAYLADPGSIETETPDVGEVPTGSP